MPAVPGPSSAESEGRSASQKPHTRSISRRPGRYLGCPALSASPVGADHVWVSQPERSGASVSPTLSTLAAERMHGAQGWPRALHPRVERVPRSPALTPRSALPQPAGVLRRAKLPRGPRPEDLFPLFRRKEDAGEWPLLGVTDPDVPFPGPSLKALLLPQVWCWSHANGSALVRMALVRDALQQRKIGQRYSRGGRRESQGRMCRGGRAALNRSWPSEAA